MDAPADVSYQGRDLEVLMAAPRYHRWIVRHFRPFMGGRTVEYGAGIGAISAKIRGLCQQLNLVEPSPNLAASLRERFMGDPQVRVDCELLESHAARQPDGSLDTVVMVNVLEHIEDDADAVRQLNRILRPGGHLLLFVPAGQYLMSDLDRLHGHFRRYGRSDLHRLISGAGFEILRIRYVDIFGILPWWLLNTVLGKTEFHTGAIRIYDNLIVPVMRRLEWLIPPPTGKNLLLIARKWGDG